MNAADLIPLLKNGLIAGGKAESVEACRVRDVYWFNIAGESTESLISDLVFSGFDVRPEVAFSKAVSERIERMAFKSGLERGLKSCQTERSDGFAAFPRFDVSASAKARASALNEAIERFVWATWWDNAEIAYEIETRSDWSILECELGPAGNMLLELRDELDLRRLHLIRPSFSGFPGKEVIIFVAELATGVITGGACGDSSENISTFLRAASELFRHGLVLVQNQPQPEELSLYERRLLYFASAPGIATFRRRITQKGTTSLELPILSIDEEIPHEFSKSHVVHRCLFEGQPPFVGGDVARMCL